MQLPPEVAAALSAGGTVIASTARAARALRRSYGEEQRSLGREAWQTPDILDWESWLSRLWQQRLRSGQEQRLLLSSLQEQQVWTRIVRPTIEGRRLISVTSVVGLAQGAYELLCNFDALEFLHGERVGTLDVESFRGWARGFESLCRQEYWLSRSKLALELRRAIEAGQADTPANLTLVGFDRTTPAQQDLIEALRGRGCEVHTSQPAATATSEMPGLAKANGKREEILACAHWIRQELSSAAAGRLPRIAVVVPAIATVRPEMERILQEVLAPATVTIREHDAPLPFEFSLGVPLLEVPLARAAYLLLRWMDAPILQDEMSWLLLSGFACAQEDELLAIASFDARVRQLPMRQREQDLETFLDLLGEPWKEAAALSALRQRLRVCRKLIPTREGVTFADWVTIAEKILSTAGWPGPHARQSEDFQAEVRWSRLLDSMAELSFDGRAVSYREFLEVLEGHAGETIFSPESHDAPVQVLGPHEAAGLTFDAMWFLGADDANWPAAARPHPFLPKWFQREQQVPHSTTEQDWKLAQQVTQRLLASAGRSIFSYATQNENGECRPSTLLNFALQEMSFAVPRQAQSLFLVQEVEDAAVVAWPIEQEAGGADVLKRQAACPFQSFAVRRLSARPMEETDWGLEPRERGTVVHGVLQALWEQLQSSDGLRKAREEGLLDDMIAQQVRISLQHYGKHLHARNLSWSRTYLDAEAERITTLIGIWLEYEAKRAAFTFESAEKKFPAVAGELKLQVRVDRIDVVNGGHVIIDYKTGEVKKGVWEGDRPDEPQLLLYASQVEDLRGLLLARVNVEKPAFVGRVRSGHAVIAQDDLTKNPLTQHMLQGWRDTLARLGEQFARGEAQVDPNHGYKTCEWCKLPGLCRIKELGTLDADAEDGEIDE